MNERFETQLQLQLRAAAQREERRGALARRLWQLRLSWPAAPALAAATLAVALLATVVLVAGLRWGDDEPVTAPHVVADVALADNLGSIHAGAGAVWAADTAKGEILRLDPRTRRVEKRIPVGGEAIVTVGAGAVWVLNEHGRLLRIDPATNRVTARTTLKLTALNVQILRGVPWVLGVEGALQINPRDGRVEHVTRLEDTLTEPFWIIGDNDKIWVYKRDEGLRSYDLGTGRRLGDLPAPLRTATGVLPTPEGPVYATHEGEIARADAGDGHIVWKRKLGTSVTGLPVPRGDTLWVHASNAAGRDRLVELDLTSGELRSSVTLPEFGAAGAALVGRQLWITTPGGKLMVLERR